MAARLGIPVGEIRGRITFGEFVGWLEFIRREEERLAKADFYAAQIAAEIRRGAVKNPKTVKISDFFLKMKTRVPAKAQTSKQIWAALLKVKVEDN